MKRTDPKTFAEIFSEAMSRVGLSDVYDEQRASYLWSEVVGPTVNRLTTRRYIPTVFSMSILHPPRSKASFLF